MNDWLVFIGGITIFGLLPIIVLSWAYYIGADLDGKDDEEHLGSLDLDHRYKRFKDQ